MRTFATQPGVLRPTRLCPGSAALRRMSLTSPHLPTTPLTPMLSLPPTPPLRVNAHACFLFTIHLHSTPCRQPLVHHFLYFPTQPSNTCPQPAKQPHPPCLKKKPLAAARRPPRPTLARRPRARRVSSAFAFDSEFRLTPVFRPQRPQAWSLRLHVLRQRAAREGP